LTIGYDLYTIGYDLYTEEKSLAQLFGSEARVRVLALLLTHPDRDFYGREIGRLTGLLPRAVHRELTRLAGIGILTREERGNRVYVRLNRDHPISPELRAIFLKTVAIGDQIRDALADVETIDVAFIYGSVAADADTLDSDLDLFIIGDIALSALSPVLSNLEHALGREVNASILTATEVAKRAKEKDPFIVTVLSEPKIFLVGTEADLKEISS